MNRLAFVSSKGICTFPALESLRIVKSRVKINPKCCAIFAVRFLFRVKSDGAILERWTAKNADGALDKLESLLNAVLSAMK